MILKTIVAFCVGLGALAAVQHFWVSSITARIAAAPQTPMVIGGPVIPTFTLDADKLTGAINPTIGRLDTTESQRLAIEGAARRVDIQNRNALSHVPLPPSYSGMPRH